MGIAVLAGKWILARIERGENRVGGGKLLTEIDARGIEVAGIGAFVEREGIFGGGDAILVRRA